MLYDPTKEDPEGMYGVWVTLKVLVIVAITLAVVVGVLNWLIG